MIRPLFGEIFKIALPQTQGGPEDIVARRQRREQMETLLAYRSRLEEREQGTLWSIPTEVDTKLVGAYVIQNGPTADSYTELNRHLRDVTDKNPYMPGKDIVRETSRRLLETGSIHPQLPALDLEMIQAALEMDSGNY
jgi:hypothetical protein